MGLFRKNDAEGEEKPAEDKYGETRAQLSTILSVITMRLEQLERKVEALEGFLPKTKICTSVVNLEKSCTGRPLKSGRIMRGETVRPFKKEMRAS